MPNSQNRPEQRKSTRVPSIQSNQDYVCIYPAKSKPAASATIVKPPAAAPKPKPEPTLEQKVADEVERRDRAGNLLLGFILGELFGQWWDQHHRD
jgi:hypothetical protein